MKYLMTKNDLLAAYKKQPPENSLLKLEVNNKFFYPGDGGTGQIIKDVMRNLKIEGQSKFGEYTKGEKEIDDATVKTTLANRLALQNDDHLLDNLINGCSQNPGYLLSQIIRSGIPYALESTVSIKQCIHNDIEHNLHKNNQGDILQIFQFNYLPVVSTMDGNLIGLIEGPINMTFKLTEKINPKTNLPESGFELINLETNNTMIHDLFLGKKFTEDEVIKYAKSTQAVLLDKCQKIKEELSNYPDKQQALIFLEDSIKKHPANFTEKEYAQYSDILTGYVAYYQSENAKKLLANAPSNIVDNIEKSNLSPTQKAEALTLQAKKFNLESPCLAFIKNSYDLTPILNQIKNSYLDAVDKIKIEPNITKELIGKRSELRKKAYAITDLLTNNNAAKKFLTDNISDPLIFKIVHEASQPKKANTASFWNKPKNMVAKKIEQAQTFIKKRL